MSVTQVERTTISTPHQFAATLPALVGFTPEESVVIAMLRDSKLVVTMRCDLPEDWESAVEEIIDTIQRIEADEVLVAVVTNHAGSEMPCEVEISNFISDLSLHNIPVSAAILVDQGRFWDYLCTVNDCCPTEGKVINSSDSVMPMPGNLSREEVAARYALLEDLQPPAEVMDLVIDELDADPLLRAERAWDAIEQLGKEPELNGLGTAGDLLRAYVQLAFRDVRVRDYALGQVVSSEDPTPFVDVITDVALRSGDLVRPRMCGAASAVLAATQRSTVPASCLANLAGKDSLAELVKAGIVGGFPPASLSEIFLDALPIVIAQLEGKESE